MPKADQLMVTWGEYKNQYDIVYQYDSSLRNSEDFKNIIGSGVQAKLVFSTWYNLEIEGMYIQLKDMSNSFLKKAKLMNIVFENCQLIGINFKQARLKDCRFINCDLRIADFSESDLENISFENCEMEGIVFEKTITKDIRIIE